MRIKPSKRVRALKAYPFAEVDEIVSSLRAKGVKVIDFGVGDPTTATPKVVREELKIAVDRRSRAGYPSYIGDIGYRKACADWMARRFGIEVSPETEITSTVGSKEMVFHLAEGFINPGDTVIVPNPGYPPYARGTAFAEGKVYHYPIDERNDFLPDLGAIPPRVRRAAKVIWINYPNSPTGRVAPESFLKEAIAFCRENDILLASDEAYSEIYYGDPPRSALEFGREGVVAVFSLSKRSAMTCYRVGWAAGDERAIAILRKVKTNVDSGTPTFIQDAAAAALADERHVARMRAEYRKKRDILVKALTRLGLEDCTPESTLYLWQKVPKGMSSVEFAKRLLDEKVAIAVTPGAWLSAATTDGKNPGEGYVRFALVPSVAETTDAAARLRKLKL